MALQVDYATIDNFGLEVTLTACCVKINQVRGTKSLVQTDVDFIINADNGASMQKTYAFIPNLNGSNFIKQAYEHLKTLPEFAGSTDV